MSCTSAGSKRQKNPCFPGVYISMWQADVNKYTNTYTLAFGQCRFELARPAHVLVDQHSSNLHCSRVKCTCIFGLWSETAYAEG